MIEDKKTAVKSAVFNRLLWLAALLLLAGLIGAHHYFKDVLLLWRFIVCLCGGSVVIALLAMTRQGRAFWQFFKEAKGELFKVVWPSREETMKVTVIVAALVFLSAIILWITDSSLLWVFSWLTRQ